MSIVSYCRRPACTAGREETLLAAAQRMEKEGIGLLVVTEEERLAGVLSDRDVALEVAARGRDASRTHIGHVMNASPVSVGSEVPLEEALGLMRDERVRRLPVVDAEGRIEGLVSADDLVRLLSREIGGLGEVLAAQLPAGASRPVGRDAPREQPVRAAEHYAREVVTASAATSIVELAREMQERAVGSVVVLDEDDRAVGLVTDRDVALRVVAAGLDPATTVASAIASTPLIAADPSVPLEEVVERMRTASVRRIPILRDGRPVGIVTFDDLLVAFGNELAQVGACVGEELRTAQIRSQRARIRHELEERVEEAAAQLRRLGDQTLRTLGGELEQVADRVVHSLRRAVVRAGGDAEPRVRDLMQTDVRCCTPDDALSEPARIMWEGDCGCVPVVAGDGSGRVVGMVTDRDICMASYTGGGRLAEMRVADTMATRLHSCRADDLLSEAERLMQSAQVRRLPVVDARGRLRGLLSLADVAQGAAGLSAPAGALSETELAHTLEAICRPRGGEPRPTA
jgi:CBS domain-containing protein